MKKGFTMIELIFVIVILGILAAVAVPRLAATRDDARLAAVKTDIGTFLNAIPAWYQGQKDARIAEAVNIDTAQWVKSNLGESYTLEIDGEDCVTIAVWESNTTAGVPQMARTGVATGNPGIDADGTYISDTNASSVPIFRVIKGGMINATTIAPYVATTVCDTLWDTTNGLGVVESNVTMAGKKVKW